MSDSNQEPKLPQLLSLEQVRKHFGVSRRTVYLWVEKGKLTPGRTPGGCLRFTIESIAKFSESQSK